MGVCVICACTVYIFIALYVFLNNRDNFAWNYMHPPLSIFTQLSFLIILLSVNKILFYKTIFQFDFIIKILYSIRSFICSILLGYIDSNSLIQNLDVFFLVITLSLIDGLQMSRKIQIICSVGTAIIFSLLAYN